MEKVAKPEEICKISKVLIHGSRLDRERNKLRKGIQDWEKVKEQKTVGLALRADICMCTHTQHLY